MDKHTKELFMDMARREYAELRKLGMTAEAARAQAGVSLARKRNCDLEHAQAQLDYALSTAGRYGNSVLEAGAL